MAFLAQNKAKLYKNLIITLVFENNAKYFAENWQKSQKIVIITSTPGQSQSEIWKNRTHFRTHFRVNDLELHLTDKPYLDDNVLEPFEVLAKFVVENQLAQVLGSMIKYFSFGRKY
jgi:hypothetical protein